MKAAPTDRAAAIFLSLSQVPPDERASLLAERCGGDEVVAREVERLLGGLNLPDSFLDTSSDRPSLRDGDVSHPVGAAVGDFIVIRQIGAGGTGVVYLAHQQHPPRTVALKVLRREFVASTIQRRFEIEAELLGHLHHPGIAQIFAAHPGDAMTPPFIAMELVSGPPLTEFADSRQMSIRDRVELLARACDAVQHAHQRGIIHRDLKPGNILVNEDGQPKVLDFGVARAIGAQVSLTTIETEAGQLVGTLAYMSPEQVEAAPEAIDTRTDIHALGVILFRLLAGRLPFGHDDPPLPELARRIAQDEPPRLGTIDPALRGDLEIIVSRALAKEKERRYASAASLANDLRRYLAGQPIAASADSAWYVVRRQLGRYRLALALSAAVGVALAGLASYAFFQRARADRVNVELQNQLATSTIERGRLLGLSGNFPIAEELVWRELFKRPESRHAQWTLSEIYSRESSLWAQTVHETGAQSVRFSPDQRHVLTGGRADGLIRLVDAESGQVVRTFTSVPQSGTLRALFIAGGKMFVSASDDGSLRVWDVESGAVRREIPKAVPGIRDVAIAGDGAYALTAGARGVQVWSLDTGALAIDFSGFVAKPLAVTANPAATVVVAGSEDGTLTAIDVGRRSLLWRVPAHVGELNSVAITPRGDVAASGGADGFIHLWSLATGERVRTIRSENGRVRNIAFDTDGRRLAAAGYWGTRLWDLEEPLQPPRNFAASEGVNDVHLRVDGRLLATSNSGSGQVRLWDLAADSRTDHWTGHSGPVTALRLGSDARSLVSAGADGVISRWYPGEQVPGLSLQPGARVGDFAVSADRRWLVSVGNSGSAAVWDTQNGRKASALPDARSSRAVVFSEDNRRLVVGEGDGTLVTWDWSNGVARNPRRTTSPDTEILAMTTSGQRLFVAHRNRTVTVRDVESGREIGKFRTSSSPFSLALSPDGRLLAVGTWLGSVDLWEHETGRKVNELKGQTALVGGVEFSHDGTLLASSSRDGSTRLWEVATGQSLATVAARKPGAERLRFLPDGQRLAIGYEDGEVEVRDLRYFFRYAAGHAEYHLRLLRAAGESFPRADDVLAWSRRILSSPAGRPN